MTAPVLIIGAGPTGLSLATGLMRNGIPCRVFESLSDLSSEARASTFHPRTLEMLAEWGVLEPLLARGYTVHQLQYWERRSRELIAQFNYQHIADDTPYPFRLQCPQNVLTRVLQPIVEASGCVDLRMSHTLTGLTDHGDHVEAVFDTPAGRVIETGRYLCAADGSRSAVRHALGVAFDGMTYEDRFLLVACDLDFSQFFAGFGPVCYLFDPSEWVIVLHLPDVTRVVFRLRDDEDEAAARQPDAIRARMSAFIGQQVAPEIRGTSVYRVHQRVAARFNVGSALILGDAAHINNPMGGMGMNSGIHDAYHLAPVLANALRHGHDDAAFERWATRRRAFALEDVRAATDKNYRDMASADTEYRQSRDAELRAIAADPARSRAWLLRAAMLEERI
jgi:3-(3-hydroxy-phenyl)propionate hydroxylase